MSQFAAPIAQRIWDMKYRLKEVDGTAIDRTVEDTWRRIAKDLAHVEIKPKYWEAKFYEALEGFKFLPAGRITAGAGAGQYGYIDTYNSGSKTATIKKHSDDTAGWDHVTGVSPVAILDDTTN